MIIKYISNKNRIDKEILKIILPYKKNTYFVEPFVGSGNLIDKIDRYRIGSNKKWMEKLFSFRY